ncbi:type II toxin-antitoxin system RelE/ParE family toxin [Methylosinus sp. KRF6]|uniref:type II toxin-antitoxin system RelE/ParE family toxin n=1 Tax=Methylosinus sp. KRF6 TaxID=2846853 RepID=UPI001C0C04DD|nr:type II toxin-antitoxin system RelE/ParE family toxin [Methylosinus sp. KRF6]MBU3887207.1 type II toxin-antitoxin system RelE/ParE family toxin [Methylosinus sp. KRF6]
MIRSFRSKALEKYWERGEAKGIKPEWRDKTRIILSRLDAVAGPEQMRLPGLGFHPLSGNMRGRYAVSVSGNWRITFAWDGEDAIEVDLEDYHGR